MARNLKRNELFNLLMSGVIAHTFFTAMMISMLQVPPDAILDSGLDEIILVFEGNP